MEDSETLDREDIAALKERIEELESQLALSRSASRANWRRFIKAQQALYGIMLWADVSLTGEQTDALRLHSEWNNACDILGWNFVPEWEH